MLGTINNSKTSWQLTRASVDGLAKSIESGQTEALASYLGVMARFHTYSARNALLIAAQRPTATHLEGIRSWRELGRFVRPGEKGIFIFAPTVAVKNNHQRADEETNGAQPETQLLGFRGVYVFDIEQTGGDELSQPRPIVSLKDTLSLLVHFAESEQMKIEYSEKIAPAKAISYRGTIRLLPKLKPAEAFPALLREIANQMLFTTRRRTFVTRAIHQQEAKAVAYVVLEALGLESKADFRDSQLYYGDSHLLAESLQIVHRIAARILGAISPESAPAKFAQGVN